MAASAVSSPADSVSAPQTDVSQPARTSPRKLTPARTAARAAQPSPQQSSPGRALSYATPQQGIGRRPTDDEILGIGDAVAEPGDAFVEAPADDAALA